MIRYSLYYSGFRFIWLSFFLSLSPEGFIGSIWPSSWKKPLCGIYYQNMTWMKFHTFNPSVICGHFFNNIKYGKEMKSLEYAPLWVIYSFWPDELKNFLIFEANDLPGMGLSSYNSESICLYKYSFQLINLVFTVQMISIN